MLGAMLQNLLKRMGVPQCLVGAQGEPRAWDSMG